AVAIAEGVLVGELGLHRDRAGRDARGPRTRARGALGVGEHRRGRLVVRDLLDATRAVLGDLDLERVVLRDPRGRAEVRELPARARVVLRDQLGRVEVRELAARERQQSPRQRGLAPQLLELRRQAVERAEARRGVRDEVVGLDGRDALAGLVLVELCALRERL